MFFFRKLLGLFYAKGIPTHGPHFRENNKLWPLALGALGVVFGDIGTSPL